MERFQQSESSGSRLSVFTISVGKAKNSVQAIQMGVTALAQQRPLSAGERNTVLMSAAWPQAALQTSPVQVSGGAVRDQRTGPETSAVP